jgi:hypothetical protein
MTKNRNPAGANGGASKNSQAGELDSLEDNPTKPPTQAGNIQPDSWIDWPPDGDGKL